MNDSEASFYQWLQRNVAQYAGGCNERGVPLNTFELVSVLEQYIFEIRLMMEDVKKRKMQDLMAKQEREMFQQIAEDKLEEEK